MVSVMLSQPHPKKKRKKERNSDYDCSNWVVLQYYSCMLLMKKGIS